MVLNKLLRKNGISALPDLHCTQGLTQQQLSKSMGAKNSAAERAVSLEQGSSAALPFQESSLLCLGCHGLSKHNSSAREVDSLFWGNR